MFSQSNLRSRRLRRLSMESLWVALGYAAAVAGALVGVRLLTELLDATSYGVLALGLTVSALVNRTLLGPLSNGAARFYAPAKEKGDLGGYVKAVHRLFLSATGIILLLIVLTILGLLLAGRREWIAISSVALVFAILSGYNLLLNGIQNAARQRIIVALHQGLASWLRFLVAAGLMVLLGATSTVAMVGYAIAICLVLGSQRVFFRRIVPGNLVTGTGYENWRQQIWKYSWPFTTWGVFGWAQQVSDRWALQVFATPQDVGLYAVLLQLGNYPISMATGMVVQLLAPIFYERAGDASDSQRTSDVNRLSWRLTGLVLGVTGVFVLLAHLFHARIFRLVVATEYSPVSNLLPWILLAGGVFAAGQTIGLNLMSRMKTRAMLAPKMGTSVLGVALNFSGSYLFGIRGVAFAGVFYAIVFFAWMVRLSMRTATD